MDSRLEQSIENLELAVKGMTSEQLSWHLPGKWCASEVLEHLYLTYTGTIKGFEKVITKGKPLAQVLSELGQVAEGVNTAPAARALAEKHGVEVPITREVCALLFENKSAQEGLADLLSRDPKRES